MHLPQAKTEAAREVKQDAFAPALDPVVWGDASTVQLESRKIFLSLLFGKRARQAPSRQLQPAQYHYADAQVSQAHEDLVQLKLLGASREQARSQSDQPPESSALNALTRAPSE
jgi:hypothetical protein